VGLGNIKNILIIINQTKHESTDVITSHYIDVDKVAYKKKYEEGFNKLSNEEMSTEIKLEPKQENKSEPKPTTKEEHRQYK